MAAATESFSVYEHFLPLDLSGKVLAEYVWIDGTGENVRCKTKVLDFKPKSPSDLPEWNFDGSSTGQAPGHDSEIMLRPVAIYKDPFRGGDHILVLCECYLPDGTPARCNNRAWAAKIFEAGKDLESWWGIEQEYTLFHDRTRPLGWPTNGFPAPQGPYYCSAGADRAFGRRIAEAHLRASLYAGLRVAGINGEVMPGQWEYQIGPSVGIDAADEMWMSRYIMHRVCEEFGVICSFAPKPIEQGDWNGAGAHTNFSTKAMRAEGGIAAIKEAINRLGAKHAEHIAVYGKGNEKRLTGKHETASIHKFSYGVADRGASIRIPRQADKEGKGYFEDRRPASNMDPYLVTAKILATSCAIPEPDNLAYN